MKIGFLLDDTLDKPDGVQQYVLTVGTWLTDQGHDVHYITGETKRKDVANVHSLAKNINVRFNKNRLSIPLPVSKRTIKKFFTSHDFDVIHIQMPFSPFFAGRMIAGAPKNVAVVGTFHILPYSNFEQRASRALAVLSAKQLKRIDAGVSVSEPAADFARKIFNFESTVIPNAINDNAGFIQPSTEYGSKLTLLFLGRLVERKGIMELLSVCKHTASELRKHSAKLVVCGRGPLEIEAKKFIAKHQLGDLVDMKGFVSEEEKIAYLASSDVAVFPSISGESFGIVLLEAMHAGAGCVIAGNNPGYSSVLKETPEALFSPQNTDEFSSLLLKCATDNTFRKKLHAKQQKMIKKFYISTVGPRLLEAYSSAIAKTRS
jgi:phosphatidyl-myo-inositol alpha-mannosyltransferase